MKLLPWAQSLLDGHSSSHGKFPREIQGNRLSQKCALIHRHNIPQETPQLADKIHRNTEQPELEVTHTDQSPTPGLSEKYQVFLMLRYNF